ncbi:MAG TPA: hypothetical protein VF702_12175 [Allosphingosinicella sp.]|jgi:hypothetical protein
MIGIKRARAGFLVVALAAGAVTAWACADPGVEPIWAIAKDRYDSGGGSAVLTPGNDTRVNLLLLLADRRGETVRDPAARREGPPLVIFPWSAMSQAAPRAPAPPDEGWEPSRCQSHRAGAAGFIAALRANPRLGEEERQRLASARTSFVPDCSSGAVAVQTVATQTPAGRAFASYLAAAADFYAGRFAEARARFAALADAPDPWVRETALYMVARSELNRAQLSSFDDYGWLAPPERRDLAAVAAAGAGLEAYLRAYPNGRYASSARGLTRRVAWLAGDREALAAAVARQIAAGSAFDGQADAVAFINEIDNSLLSGETPPAPRNPLLLAVVDLQRMRCLAYSDQSGPPCPERIGREELERQAPLFAGEEALFGYLRASEAFYVRSAPREVISLIPDAARQPRFTYLEFSRQVLRGLALDAVGDPNARAFWLSLFEGAVQPYQREALELALAIHDERGGNLDRIFAAESQVRHPVIRQILLEHSAGPDVLRRQARDGAVPQQERDVAAYILLAKQLRRGRYRDFLSDMRLVPSGAEVTSGYYEGAARFEAVDGAVLTAPPLAFFAPGASVGEAGCRDLRSTVAQLAARPNAPGPRLCLAEFFRLNGFDDFPFDEPAGESGLGSGRSQFPGPTYHRLEVYKAVMADPAATPDQRAFALNRAIRCYGPSGYNSCGGVEVDVAQRRAWFQRLKQDYPNSRWAQSLRYYW